MPSQAEKASRFAELHRSGEPLLMPNPWDAGSAKMLTSLGFRALATTSSGSAATLGKLDGAIGRKGALENARLIVAATDLPVSADLENCFAVDTAGVAETVRLAREAGLAGCSIEDYAPDRDAIYEPAEAVERVSAAAAAAHENQEAADGPARLVLTARCENFLHGREDLEDTIARLQAYAQAGADVLYAPGLTEAEQIRRVVEAVDRPVNVLLRPGIPSVAELAELGVARVSVGGGFAFAALGALVQAAQELREGAMSEGYWRQAAVGVKAARAVFEQ